MSVEPGVDPQRLEEAGWGLVLPAEDFLPYKTLNALVEWRARQAGGRIRVFEGGDGVRSGETWRAFRNRHGAGPGPVEPEQMPYFLLLAGSLEQIPLAFQQEAAVQHAVGRLHFDEWNDGLAYAEQLVEREQGEREVQPRVTLFGPRHPDDPVTSAFYDALLRPLAAGLTSGRAAPELDLLLGPDASRAALRGTLQRGTTSLLMAAGHSAVFPTGADQQRAEQGALLAQEYPGPLQMTSQGAFPSSYYIGPEDIDRSIRLEGMLAILLGSYTAATPGAKSVERRKGSYPTSPPPFISQLAQRFLARGASGVVGCAGQLWAHRLDTLLDPLDRIIQRLLSGSRVGTSMDVLRERYAEIASELSYLVEEADYGATVEEDALVAAWIARENSRNLVLLGDPAARLPLTSVNS